jgi:aspartate carbamoyltransferase regulatory subunit
MLLNKNSYIFAPKATIKQVRDMAVHYKINLRTVAFIMWLTIPNINLVDLINLLEIDCN